MIEDQNLRSYDVEKGQKTESYRVAIQSGRSASSPIKFEKIPETANTVPAQQDEPLLNSDGKDKKKFGLTHAELKKYSDDRFWRFLRTLLFALFWLLWICSFAISIAIILMSPKCAEETKNWWDSAIIYNIWTPSFQDSNADGIGDLAGIEQRLDELQSVGVDTIWPEPILKFYQSEDGVPSYMDVDERFGSLDELKHLINKVHEQGMQFIITLPIQSVSNYQDSISKREASNLPHINSKNDTYTYANNELADNQGFNVICSKIIEVLKFWIKQGVDAFYLENLEHCDGGPKINWTGVNKLLGSIKDSINIFEEAAERSNKTILLLVRFEMNERQKLDLLSDHFPSLISPEMSAIDSSSGVCKGVEQSTVASCFIELFNDVNNFHKSPGVPPPVWELGSNKISRLATRINSSEQTKLLIMLYLLLPGAKIFYYGDEIGMFDLPEDLAGKVLPQRGAMLWEDSENGGFTEISNSVLPVDPLHKNNSFWSQKHRSNSQLNVFTKLARLRQRDPVLSLGLSAAIKVDEAVLFVRYLQNAIYLGVANFKQTYSRIRILELNILQEYDLSKGQIVAHSGDGEFYDRQLIDLSSGLVSLPALQGVVIKFTL